MGNGYAHIRNGSYGNAPISPIEEHAARDQDPFTSNVSPIEERNPKSANPFSNDYSYVEDYGAEYHHGYDEVENGLYGGNTSFSRYPEPSKASSKNSKTEWPLRNTGARHARTKSPLWDRVYDGT